MLNATVGGVFDGIGLLAYGLTLAGWEHRWLCEVDPWRRELLALRWPGVRIYDDVRAVDAGAERPLLIAGGFPCKGASTSGLRNGFDHPETVLWREMARAIRELRPRYVLVENVANLLSVRDGAVWGEVLGDLAACGYDTSWDCIPAAAFGAPHLRDRVIAVATYTQGIGEGEPTGQAHALADRRDARTIAAGRDSDAIADANGNGLRPQPIPKSGRSGTTFPRWPATHAPEPGQRRCKGLAPVDGTQSTIALRHAGRSGVSVEWGTYGPAVRRWEKVVGPAPEPLCSLRGVDARSTARVERSRLRALGDGVQVQLGRLAGEYILELEKERLAA